MRSTVDWQAGKEGVRITITHSGWLTWHLVLSQGSMLFCEAFRYRVTITAYAVNGNGTITARVSQVCRMRISLIACEAEGCPCPWRAHMRVCVCVCVCGPPHQPVPPGDESVVLQKGAQPTCFSTPSSTDLFGLTRFVSDQCSALFVTPVRPA